MKNYIVSTSTKSVVDAYAQWKGLQEEVRPTVMADGWTLPSLKFVHLYEAHAAALDLAMVSGSVKPFLPHEVLITEFHATLGLDAC